MGDNLFFRFSWISQILICLTLFSTSFLLELLVMRHFLPTAAVVIPLVAVLEGSKVLAIIWRRYIAAEFSYPLLVQALFRQERMLEQRHM